MTYSGELTALEDLRIIFTLIVFYFGSEMFISLQCQWYDASQGG